MHNAHKGPASLPEARSLSSVIEEIFSKPVLIFGCGNILFGDDGFGPEVTEYLRRRRPLPDRVFVADVGGAIRDFLFDLLLAPRKPESILIVDAVSMPGREPGELFELDVHELPVRKTNDFSVHHFPSLNLLGELESLGGVNVRVLAVQAKSIPDRVSPGLSPEVKDAIPRACSWLIRQIEGNP